VVDGSFSVHEETPMRRMLVPLAVLGLALTAGCGGKEAGNDAAGVKDPAAAAANAVAASDAKRQQAENLTADCMKQQGFQYVPYASAEVLQDSARFAGGLSVLEPADEVRKFRQKYGFAVFGRLVYPNDPAVAVPKVDPAKNPNNVIREGLDAGRRKAYDLALNGNFEETKGSVEEVEKKMKEEEAKGKKRGCANESYSKAFGDAEQNATDQKAKERAYQAFQTDPEAVAAAQKWADCLRGQGYKVEFTSPGEIDLAMATAAADGKLPAGPGENGDVKVPTGDSMTAAVGGSAPIPPAEAKAGLQREIKAALADLDCRTDYATLVRAKYAKVLIDGNGQG
jgi:hypothetical protein